MTRDTKLHDNYTGWGWKEPNSHILLPSLADHFDNLKYIHTIRHVLDMAFSRNQNQLYDWSKSFSLEIPYTQSQTPSTSLRFWLKANERAIELGKELGTDKFLLVNFDKLCASPQEEIARIISFLSITPSISIYRNAIKLPITPGSVGRYHSHDLSQFDQDDLSKIESMGFSI